MDMDTVYRVVLEFETREDAESCIDVLGNWESSNLEEIVYTEWRSPVAPPDNPFVTYSVEELIRLVKVE